MKIITSLAAGLLDASKADGTLKSAIVAAQAADGKVSFQTDVESYVSLAAMVKGLTEAEVFKHALADFVLDGHGKARAAILEKYGKAGVKATGARTKVGFTL